MKKLIRQIFVIAIMVLFVMIILMGGSKAALQSNPNTHYKKTDHLDAWRKNIRNMEKLGEGMGLNETLNEDLTPSSESNNIDVHLIRSTEYGAIAILSASGYGNPEILQESIIKTTTGNKTGIYFSGENWEYVAGGVAFGSSRYYDAYISSSPSSAKVGDALGSATAPNPGCAGWHNAGNNYWVTNNAPNFVRGANGLFTYYFDTSPNGVFARGVAVCGAGF